MDSSKLGKLNRTIPEFLKKNKKFMENYQQEIKDRQAIEEQTLIIEKGRKKHLSLFKHVLEELI
jgi:Sec-independent protein translocase protein TatA